LSKEFDVVSKHDEAIRAVEFVVNISEDLAADYDSVRAGMIEKLAAKFDSALVDQWLDDFNDAKNSVLQLKL
jgi:hypothetical protein